MRLHWRWERADEVPAHARRLVEYEGKGSPLGVVGMYAECWKYYSYYPYRMLFRFPMWSEPAAIRSARARCVGVRD